MAVRIGVSFDGFAPLPDAVAVAREAARAGARSFWMAEHLGYREAFLSCLAYALATEHAMVVPTAVSPYLRHPMPTAMAMATLEEAAPGRVALAVGIGNPLFLREAGIEPAKPVRAVREYVECLRALWSGQPVAYQGGLYRLDGAKMAFAPSAPIPIYIAAMRSQSLRLAGRIADGVVLSAGLSPGFAAHSLAECEAGAKEAGRDPASVRRAGYLYCAPSADGRGAIETLRQKLAFLLRNKFMDENIRHSGIPIDQEAIIAAVARRDLVAAARLVPDEAIEAFTVAGTPRESRRRLERYLEAGLTELVLALVGGDEQVTLGLDLVREFSGR